MRRPLLAAFYVGPLLAWMAFIFLMSTDAGSASHSTGLIEWVLARFAPHLLATLSAYQLDRLDFAVRKLGHLSEYMVLTLLAVRAIQFGQPRFKVSAFFGALSLSILYAFTDEIHQHFVHGRTASPIDVLIDTTGAVLCMIGILLWFGVKHIERRLCA